MCAGKQKNKIRIASGLQQHFYKGGLYKNKLINNHKRIVFVECNK